MSDAADPPRRQASRLALKVGGSAGALVTPEILQRAHDRLQQRAPAAFAEIEQRLDEMSLLAAAPSHEDARRIFQHAHEIRGVCGTFGRASVGDVADALCIYLDDLPPDAAPSADLVRMLVNAMRLVVNEPMGARISEIVSVSRVAVRTVRLREGRSAELV